MRALSSATIRSVARCCAWLAVVLLLGISGEVSQAQMGPVDVGGFLEYRYSQFKGDNIDKRSAQGLLLKTNLSTFFWRPWILNATGHISLAQRKADARLGDEKSGDVYGGLRLNFLARSKFPLSIYYDDFDGSVESDTNLRSGRTRRYGALQQYTSRRLGNYSLEWGKGSTDILYQDGFRLPERNENQRWQFMGRKTFGRNMISLSSISLSVDSEIPARQTESLRHTLRHTFRAGSSFNIRNTVFYTDEKLDSEMLRTGRTYRQLSSITTWRPNTAKRLLITARGLLQDSMSRGLMLDTGVQTLSISGTANYQYSQNLTFTGGLGLVSADNDTGESMDRSLQRIGVNYNSNSVSVANGDYRYFGQVSVGNRSDPGDSQESDVQDLGTSIGHSFTRTLAAAGGASWDFKVSQRGSTVHDTASRKRNTLQHSISLTNGVRSGDTSRYIRLSVLDQRSFADEPRNYQIANLQYTMQGQVSRNRSWNVNASVQYGRREQEASIVQAIESTSLSYSIAMNYRHAELFDVNNLTFTSDLRWISEDVRTEDPFDPDFELETDRLNSSWRNRLEYRIGLLRLRADADVREVDGMWSTSLLLQIRRYFDMR